MTAGSMSRRGLQESALEIYRSFRPILRRCASFAHPNERHTQPPKAVRMAIQQAENLKWQQDMYVRLLKMMGLVQEGLIKQEDLSAFRQRLLDNLTASHTAGEWPEFTRDKLLFLQELFYAKCISEAEYHVAKKPLLLRLAEQGAEIDSNDIILYSSAEPSSPSTSEAKSFHRTVQVLSNRKKNNTKPTVEEAVPKKSPVKHVFEAMSRFKVHPSKANNEEKTQIRVPHALDFLRPTDCPIRDPPNPPHPDPFPHDNSPSPLFYSPGGSISSVESSSKAPSRRAPVLGFPKDEASPVSLFATPKKAGDIASQNPAARNLFPSPPETKKSPLSEVSNNKGGSGPRVATLLSDLMRKLQGDTVKQMSYDDILSDDDEEEVTSPRVKSRLDFIKPPPRRFPIQEDANVDENETPLSPGKVPKPTPDTVKLKKNIHAKGSGTDFFIDKVLGENIKKELDRIRLEMSRTNPTQMFTNDQIDAISTRLPADKAELMRFFPKQWCDRYGDIVLDVVHKEFKGHISDMEVARKEARERRKVTKYHQENDENSENGVTNTKKSGATVKAVNLNRCFTTMDVNVAYVPLSQENQLKTPRKLSYLSKEAEYERELDGKLHAEILKMPHRRTPDTLPLRV